MIDVRAFIQQPTVDALAWTLLHFVWQGALFGFAAFFLLRVVRPDRAAARYGIGVATLAMMLISCITTFALLAGRPAAPDRDGDLRPMASAIPQLTTIVDETVTDAGRTRSEQPAVRAVPAASASRRPAALGPQASLVLVLAWGIGVLALSLRLLGGWMLTRSLTRHAVSSVSPAIVAAAEVISERLRLRRAVAIVESGAVAVPTLVGWMKPVVLLPVAALSGLSPEQLHAILAHELAHVRRHDYLVNLLQSVIETLLFYHPAMWWVSAQVRTEREHCCDDLAVEVCGDRLVYVTALAELTTITSHRAFALAATDGSLVGRVQRILGRPRSVHEPTPAWAVLALFILIAGSIGSSSEPMSAAVTPKPAMARVAEPARSAAHRESGHQQGTDRRFTARHEGAAKKVARLNPPAETSASTIAPPEETAAFLSTQWFRGWFESTPPPPPPPAPPSPPAPPAPPAPAAAAPAAPPAPAGPAPPPAPEAPQGPSGSGNMSWSDGDDKVTVKWSGAFRLSDDEKDISWMEDGATLSIADGILLASRIDLRGANGTIERRFTKNGVRREYEPEGRLFLAAAIDKLIRHSALFAKDRVARFLKRGGPDAVLAEIDRLGKSSYTHRVYYTELARQAELSAALLTKILQRVPSEMSSDYDKATLFTMIAKLPAVTDAHRVQVAHAVRNISSDYDQRRTLAAIMDVRPLASNLAAAVLDAAGSINSSYDRSQVLTELVERDGLTTATAGAFAGLVQSMGSSYDKRRVLTAVTARPNVPKEALTAAIDSTSSMGSSHDRSETLIKLVASGALTEASAGSFFQSAAQIPSSHDLSRVLRRVVDQPALDDGILERVLRTAARISSSHDRANLLEAIAARGRVTGTSRQLYIDATTGMGSHDGNRALAALVRSER